MDWLFKKLFGEVLPPDEMILWLFDTYEWLLRFRGGINEFKRQRKLILPINENFTITEKTPEGIARELFDHVKWYARMEDWNCKLQAHDDSEMAQQIRPLHNMRPDEGVISAAGTFSMAWDHSMTTITYSPHQLENYASLVATFAHELSHFYLATVPFAPPAGPTAEEHATDVCAVHMGFGIFLANTAISYSNGAVVARKGYLGEVALSYALAIFTALRQVPAKDVCRHLNSNPRSFFKSAVRDIDKRWSHRMEALRNVTAHDE